MHWHNPKTVLSYPRTALAVLLQSCLLVFITGCASIPESDGPTEPYLVVLGIAQDGGVPQIGTPPEPVGKKQPLWQSLVVMKLLAHPFADRRLVVSLAVVDPQSKKRWLFEATPDIKEQLYRLDMLAPVADPAPGLSGIFLTHAHMGHYTGLAQLGHEALGAKEVPVYVMPRMGEFLSGNGPWDQLVRYGNISLRVLAAARPVRLNARLNVTPVVVPHRQEYSEVVGFIIAGPHKRVLFIPDIDNWEALDAEGTRIEDLIASVDLAYLDGTFFANGEIPGRDMSGFPHPFITHSLQRFSSLPVSERAKIRFIHLNHTNPALRAESKARQAIVAAGFGVAEEMAIEGL